MAQTKEIIIPDLGGANDVEVIEILVQSGQRVNEEDPLITLEGDKASMEVPSPYSGAISALTVKEGDHVSEGDQIGTIDIAASESKTDSEEAENEPAEAEQTSDQGHHKEQESTDRQLEPTESASEIEPTSEKEFRTEAEHDNITETAAVSSESDVHAGPAVRRMAHELGVELSQLSGSGPKGRVIKADVQQFVKKRMSESAGGGSVAIGAIPEQDYSQYGDIERQPLNKIKRLTGDNLHRSWLNVPHVTQFDEADITELEAFRQDKKTEAEKEGIKLTPLAFIMKAAVAALKAFPEVNSSLAADGQELILKHYYHIGVAVDTAQGLVVPVIRDVDRKGVFQLARELAEVSKKAREKGLSPNDMKGASFTISSLGGIGGTGFTPIVNAPQVAIMGVAKSQTKPVYQDGEFVARLMLPFSLSYDHRVIDGAQGARFTQYVAKRLTDLRTLIL